MAVVSPRGRTIAPGESVELVLLNQAAERQLLGRHTPGCLPVAAMRESRTGSVSRDVRTVVERHEEGLALLRRRLLSRGSLRRSPLRSQRRRNVLFLIEPLLAISPVPRLPKVNYPLSPSHIRDRHSTSDENRQHCQHRRRDEHSRENSSGAVSIRRDGHNHSHHLPRSVTLTPR